MCTPTDASPPPSDLFDGGEEVGFCRLSSHERFYDRFVIRNRLVIATVRLELQFFGVLQRPLSPIEPRPNVFDGLGCAL